MTGTVLARRELVETRERLNRLVAACLRQDRLLQNNGIDRHGILDSATVVSCVHFLMIRHCLPPLALDAWQPVLDLLITAELELHWLSAHGQVAPQGEVLRHIRRANRSVLGALLYLAREPE